MQEEFCGGGNYRLSVEGRCLMGKGEGRSRVLGGVLWCSSGWVGLVVGEVVRG